MQPQPQVLPQLQLQLQLHPQLPQLQPQELPQLQPLLQPPKFPQLQPPTLPQLQPKLFPLPLPQQQIRMMIRMIHRQPELLFHIMCSPHLSVWNILCWSRAKCSLATKKYFSRPHFSAGILFWAGTDGPASSSTKGGALHVS